MNTTFRRICSRWLIVSLAAAAVTVSGCRAAREARAERRAARAANAVAGAVKLDGRFGEWPATASTIADANWVYFRVTVDGQAKPLQASDSTLALWLDVDDNPATGKQMPSPRVAAAIGVDLVVEFSPQDDSGKATSGVAAYTFDASGAKVVLSQAQLELAAAPTVAASSYEIRISRYPDPSAAPVLSRLLSAAGQARGMFVLVENAKVVGWSDPEALRLPAAGKGRPEAGLTVPAKAPGTIRVMSYNVLKNEPAKNPGPFARMIQVIKPDVILFQEWDADEATARAWFTAVVSGETKWYAASGKGGDVLIVSPHPIRPLLTESVRAEGVTNPVRFVSGIVSTPQGDFAVGSTHLKCCGTVGSSEDKRRIAEATAIRAAMDSALGATSTPVRIIGGDLNLVGSSTPLEILGAKLDFDGSSLSPVEAEVLGDPAVFTWFNTAERFPPGRLDYILFSDSTATAVNSFILDTRRLNQKALAAMGLDRNDSAASDHMPLVVDLKPR
jgi:endonuclease/exonuclease/phosphatase family metal-dependent hydrolase